MAIPTFAPRYDTNWDFQQNPYYTYNNQQFRVNPLWDAVPEGGSTIGGYSLWSDKADNGGPAGDAYGHYYQNYDVQGNPIGTPAFANAERSNGHIGDNLDLYGPLLVSLFAGGAAALGGGGAAAGGSGWVNGFDLAGGGSLAGWGPAEVGLFSSLPPAAQTALQKLGPTVAKQVLNAVTGGNSGTGGTGMDIGRVLSGGVDAATMYKLYQELKDLGITSKNDMYGLGADYRGDMEGLGGSIFDQYLEWATNKKNMAEGYGAKGAQGYKDTYKTIGDRWSQFADNILPNYQNVRDTYLPKYENLSQNVKDAVGTEFKPYNITTNVGSTDGNKFTPTTGVQRILSGAEGTAGDAFAAADAYDMNNIRQQEFDLMQQLLGPVNQQKRVATEERLRKQGRLDAAGGQGYNPQMYALEQAIANGDLNAYLNADENALKRYQGTIAAGREASSVPLAYSTEGRGMLNLGGDLGATDASQTRSNVQTWAPYAEKPINYGSSFDLGLVDKQTGLKQKAVEAWNAGDIGALGEILGWDKTAYGDFWKTNEKGFDTRNRLFEEGIEGDYKFRGEGVRLQQRAQEKALNAMANFVNQAGGALSGALQGVDWASIGKKVTDWITANPGATDEQINQEILRIVDTDPYGDTSFEALFGDGGMMQVTDTDWSGL